jgi:outer membrane lipoprotein-sorting protein
MKKIVLFAWFAWFAVNSYAQTAEELLAKVDANEIYTSIIYEGDMVIENNGRRFTKTMKAWAKGSGESFIEFTNREDTGTKYLKTGGRLYVYSPDTEEVMLISGHMLKESMMGSDLSYEDTMDNDTLSSRYTPTLTGSETWTDQNTTTHDCWLLHLEAKRKTETYPTQTLWIEKSTGDLLHYELFALSGAKLKEASIQKIEIIGGRRFPVEVEMKDLLRKNSKTVFTMRNVQLDVVIPNSVFTQRNLRK